MHHTLATKVRPSLARTERPDMPIRARMAFDERGRSAPPSTRPVSTNMSDGERIRSEIHAAGGAAVDGDGDAREKRRAFGGEEANQIRHLFGQRDPAERHPCVLLL